MTDELIDEKISAITKSLHGGETGTYKSNAEIDIDFSESNDRSIKATKWCSEIFYQFIKNEYPSINIHQVRLGISLSSGDTMIAFFIDKESPEKTKNLRSVIRLLEDTFLNVKYKYRIKIWLLTGKVRRDMINTEYPWVRHVDRETLATQYVYENPSVTRVPDESIVTMVGEYVYD